MHKSINTYIHTHSPNSSSPELPKWSPTLRDHDREPFTQQVGPTVSISDSPLDTFELFFTPEIMQYIVDETNRYADQMQTPAQKEQWTPLTVDELKAYMGFCMLMGIVRLPSIEDYWKRDPHFHYSPIASKISWDRFHHIRQYLHFADNTTIPLPGTPGSDRLAKIHPLIDKINKRCSEVYNLSRDVSVDEAMVKF